MSTNAVIHFCAESKTEIRASIYRHWDGYPDTESGVLADFARFCDAVEHDTSDHRYGDPSYLAAKFVVWMALKESNSTRFVRGKAKGHPERPLDFLGVGIIPSTWTQEYAYYVLCTASHNAVRPEILCEPEEEAEPK
jgi:hypothetical protein